jgi:hypothetical protein
MKITPSKLPPLYKVDNKGSLREWKVETSDDSYTISYGLVGKQLRTRTVRTQKNLARIKAYESWKNMLEESYTVNLNSLLGKVFAPMQPVKLYGNSKFLRYPVLVHKNYEGFRCIARENSIISENGDSLHNLKHITKWTKKVAPVVYLDGELYSDKLTHKQIMDVVINQDTDVKTNSIKLVIYDAFIEDIPEATYDYRKMMIDNIVKSFREQGCTVIESVALFKAEFPEIIDAYRMHFEKEGYSGIIIHNPQGIYRPGEESTDVFVSNPKSTRKRENEPKKKREKNNTADLGKKAEKGRNDRNHIYKADKKDNLEIQKNQPAGEKKKSDRLKPVKDTGKNENRKRNTVSAIDNTPKESGQKQGKKNREKISLAEKSNPRKTSGLEQLTLDLFDFPTPPVTLVEAVTDTKDKNSKTATKKKTRVKQETAKGVPGDTIKPVEKKKKEPNIETITSQAEKSSKPTKPEPGNNKRKTVKSGKKNKGE